MRRTAGLSLALLLLFGAGLGCGAGGQVRRGVHCYKVGEYGGALMTLQELECCEHKMSTRALVRYYVYRGLSHFHLGHRDAAKHFLTQGRHAWIHHGQRFLPEEAVVEMNHALAALSGSARPVVVKGTLKLKGSGKPAAVQTVVTIQ